MKNLTVNDLHVSSTEMQVKNAIKIHLKDYVMRLSLVVTYRP